MWNFTFIMLSKVVLTFRSVDETLVCDHSKECQLAIRLLCCTRWLQLSHLRMKPWCVTIQMKAIEQSFHVVVVKVCG